MLVISGTYNSGRYDLALFPAGIADGKALRIFRKFTTPSTLEIREIENYSIDGTSDICGWVNFSRTTATGSQIFMINYGNLYSIAGTYNVGNSNSCIDSTGGWRYIMGNNRFNPNYQHQTALIGIKEDKIKLVYRDEDYNWHVIDLPQEYYPECDVDDIESITLMQTIDIKYDGTIVNSESLSRICYKVRNS